MLDKMDLADPLFDIRQNGVNPFPHDKILDKTKLKALADDKLNVTKMTVSVSDE